MANELTSQKRLQISALLGVKIAAVIAVLNFFIAAMRGNLSPVATALIVGASILGGVLIAAIGYFIIKPNGGR